MHFSFDSLFNTTFASLKLNMEKIDAHVFACTQWGFLKPPEHWNLVFLVNMIKKY